VQALRLRTLEAVDTPVIKSLAAYGTGDLFSAPTDVEAKESEWAVVQGWRADSLSDTWQPYEVDLTARIQAPGQYHVRLRESGGDAQLEVKDAVVVMSKTEAPRLITPLAQPHAWNINRTAQVTTDERGRTLLRFAARKHKGSAWEGVLEIRAVY